MTGILNVAGVTDQSPRRIYRENVPKRVADDDRLIEVETAQRLVVAHLLGKSAERLNVPRFVSIYGA